MHPKLLLFDIDATLLRTGGAGMTAMANVANRLFAKPDAPFRWDDINAGGSLDPVIFAQAAALNGIENNDHNHSRFHDQYIAELEKQIPLHPFEVLPGIHDLITHLRQRESTRRDIVLGLLTGNYTKAVPVKFKPARLDQTWFSITAFGDEAPSRPDLVALAMKKFQAKHGHRPDPKRIIVIGDTPRDVHCAKAHGCVAFTVATGHHPRQELLDCGADHCVDNLADPSPLLRLLD